MALELKYSSNQQHQVEAVESVCDLFRGQQFASGSFSVDSGRGQAWMDAVGQGNEILLRLFEMQKQRGMDSFRQNIVQSCQEIRVNTDEGVRLQLLYYLVGVAKADNVVTPEEVNALQELAYHLGIDPSEVVSMLNLDGGYSGGGQTATESDKLAEAYKVLGVDPSATNDEVKAAYRKMALKHHPDRVAALGEDVRKSAERKFQEINDAKERVYASRGMN